MQNKPDDILNDALHCLQKEPNDQEAWRELFKATWPFVLTVSFRLTQGDKELAKDLAQEVFLRIHKYCNFKNFKEIKDVPVSKAFRGYLWSTCHNVARSHFTRTSQKSFISLEDLSGESPDLAISPLSSEIGLEMENLIERAIGTLDQKDKRLVELMVWGFTLQEISEITGLTYENVAVRTHRLRKKLKEYMDKEQKNDPPL
jgi:RNA polymerase sigma factor (sigma-70 family)